MTDRSTGPVRPAARYGGSGVPPAGRRRIALWLGILVAAICVALAAVAYQRYETLDVQGEAAAFQVLDDQTVEITISVTRQDPTRPAVCIVRARSYDGAETGRREVLVAPSEAKTVQVTTTVKTFRRSVVGDIYGCGINVPEYLVGG
jgi:hypothetical protein